MNTERLETIVRDPAPSLIGFLVERFGYRDRARWNEVLARGELSVDGRVVTEDVELPTGSCVGMTPPDRPEDEPAVTILWDDPHFVAVDKTPALVCMRLSAFPQRTFVRGLERRLGGIRLEPAHRLDRGTSGVVILAKSADAFAAFQRSFASREVTKTYFAVATGDFRHSSLEIAEPIGLHPHGVIPAQRAVLRDGARGAKPAATFVERVAGDGARTLLHVFPRTGRTHQIRVHLAAVGHPLVGDLLYGGPPEAYQAYARNLAVREIREPGVVARHLLHAARLEFRHPIAGRSIVIDAPNPDDMRTALRTKID